MIKAGAFATNLAMETENIIRAPIVSAMIMLASGTTVKFAAATSEDYAPVEYVFVAQVSLDLIVLRSKTLTNACHQMGKFAAAEVNASTTIVNAIKDMKVQRARSCNTPPTNTHRTASKETRLKSAPTVGFANVDVVSAIEHRTH